MAGVLSKSKILEYTGGSTKGADILAASKKYGFGASDVDEAFKDVPGYTAGTSQRWLDQNVQNGTVVDSTTPWYNLPNPQTGNTTTAPASVVKPTPVESKEFSGMAPQLVTVDPEKSTVAGQLKGILASSSPLMKLAESKGIMYANRRGLQNSSIGAGSAMREVINAALPIASQDAQTNWNSQTLNQAALNRGSEVNVDSTNKAALTQADIELEKMRNENQRESDASIERTNRVTAFSNAAAVLRSSASSRIADLQNDSTLDPATRQSRIDDINRQFDADMRMLGATLDIDTGTLLNFPNAPSAQQSLAQTRITANASAGNEEQAIRQVYNAAASRGLTLEQAAAEVGMTPDQAAAKLAQIGVSLPSANQPAYDPYENWQTA